MVNQNEYADPSEPSLKAPTVLVIAASLNPGSRSYRLAESAADALGRLGAKASLIDLRNWELPLCDGVGTYDHPSVDKLTARIQEADAVLLAAPVYNYDLNAAAKNLIELTGDAWTEKPVGFLCSAGGKSSYMSPIGLANSLMFDFRSWIIPRFVYATKQDFDGDLAPLAHIRERIEQLARTTLQIARALQWIRSNGAGVKGAQPSQG